MVRRSLLCLITLAALVGCGSDSPTIPLQPTDADVTGTFDLELANGTAPPYPAFQTSTALWYIANDRMVLAADNTYADTTSYTVVLFSDGTQSSQTTTSAGTYQISNNQINFTATTNGANTFTGSVTGNILVLLFNGGRFIYTRPQS